MPPDLRWRRATPVYVARVAQFHFSPDTYLNTIREEVPAYDELQAAVADAADGVAVDRILDLGAGTGETTRAVLSRHPSAAVVLLDESPAMLARATARLPDDRVEQVIVGDLLGALPTDRFDLVVSALAVHHLAPPDKRTLFDRVRSTLRPGGRFVLGDVVVPDDPADAVAPLSPGYDRPDRLDDQRRWLEATGFTVSVPWRWKDLAVLRADAPTGTDRSRPGPRGPGGQPS